MMQGSNFNVCWSRKTCHMSQSGLILQNQKINKCKQKQLGNVGVIMAQWLAGLNHTLGVRGFNSGLFCCFRGFLLVIRHTDVDAADNSSQNLFPIENMQILKISHKYIRLKLQRYYSQDVFQFSPFSLSGTGNMLRFYFSLRYMQNGSIFQFRNSFQSYTQYTMSK